MRLIEEFHAALAQALEWTQSPERLKFETDPGSSLAEGLRSLAVQNAYHLGKIVALR